MSPIVSIHMFPRGYTKHYYAGAEKECVARPIQYLPFGEEYVSEHTASPYTERFTFAGKERDEETGYTYHGARYYDASLMCSWFSVDPLSDKYPSLSPYNYCAWNPVKLIDPDGKEFWLGESNRQACSKDIMSLLTKKKNSKYVIIGTDGKVTIDFGDLSESKRNKILSKDSGLDLIYSLVNSDRKFLYETVDGQTSTTAEEGFSTNMDDNNHGIINASNNGLDSKNGHNYHPKEGFDGHVVLANTGIWYDNDGHECRSSVLFHELAENYYRTDRGIPYLDKFNDEGEKEVGAHNRAISLEGSSQGNCNPGVFTRGPLSKAAYYYKDKKVW